MSGSGRVRLAMCTMMVRWFAFGESERLENSMAQIKRFKRVAVDGKSGRFEAEKYLAEWHAGAADKAMDKQEYDVRVRTRRGRKKPVRREGSYLDPTCDSNSEEGCDLPQVADKAREEYAKGRDMRAAATAAATTKCTAQLWTRKKRRTGSYLDMNFDARGRSSSEMGVQLFNGQEEECDDLCYTNVTGHQ